MCGRFYIDDDTAREIERTVRKVDEQLRGQRVTGDIYPTQAAGVIQSVGALQAIGSMQDTGSMQPVEMMQNMHEQERFPTLPGELFLTVKKWGFPGFNSGRVIINARAESVLEKRMFRDSVLKRRLVVPASGYYEWNQSKEKVTFTGGAQGSGQCIYPPPALYMAGFYKRFGEEERFVILTTAANESVRTVHDRMPLILEAEEVMRWLQDDELVEAFLHRKPRSLQRTQEFEQQVLKF